jgi:hypothetical protein
MEHHFELPVEYKGEELNLTGRLSTFGFVYRLFITIEGQEYVFEKDDHEKYRVLSVSNSAGQFADQELIESVIDVLDSLSGS